MRVSRPAAGFTIIELVVTMGLLGILMVLALPSMNRWVLNTQVRSVAQSLQDGIRLAQQSAAQRSRVVVMSLTNANPALNVTAVANGMNWSLQTIPSLTDTQPFFLQGGSLAEVARGVTITGPAVTCFDSKGWMVAHATPGVGGAVCAIDPVNPSVSYDVAKPGSDRPLRVVVTLGGEIRMCDPAKSLSATHPDGC